MKLNSKKSILTRLKSINHLYSKLIILYCIAFASGASIYALLTLHDTGYDGSGILAIIMGFFGGELLLLCLKTVLSKNEKGKTDEKSEDEENDTEAKG